MKRLTKCFLFAALMGSFWQVVYGQVPVPFSPRLNSSYINIKGDYTFLANSILNRVDASHTANDPYDGTANNNNFHRDYIDIDGDPTTFSSSSSTLDVPFCSRIYWAGLYWSANYEQEVMNNTIIPTLPAEDPARLDFTAIKFRVPGGSYVDLVADNLADPAGEEDSIIFDDVTFKDSPYVCFKNVTNLLQALPDPNGEYFVANVRATRGVSVGGAGGWTLVVIYENPTLPGKYISVFDGYAGVSNTGSATANIAVSGFNTIPSGPVRARIGASAVEGDRSISGDRFRIETPMNPGFTDLSDPMNPANNYFNSNITVDGADVATRNIFATNTLGYDADIFDISNPSNSIIDNGETSATLQLTTQGDGYGAFLVGFAVEIIEPNIVLEKRVENLSGVDITGAGVNLGQSLDYVLSFQNTGNDDATNYSIRDILPTNVTLDESNLVLPPGVTYTYDAVTREIRFSIPDNLIELGDPVASIRIRAQVASNCYDFVNACDNQIQNLAYSTYEGVINDNQISDDPSVSDFDACGFVTPGATNFLLDDLSDCDYTRTVLLCGEDLLLDAGNDFDAYIWVQDTNGNLQIDPSDPVLNDGDPDGDPSTLIVTEPGTYIVNKLIPDPCIDSEEIIIVELFGAIQSNPITALINDPTNTVDGEILICPNDGEELPQIFLCGLNDTELIQLNIPDADSIIWEQLDEASCTDAAVGCANKNNTCTWNTVGTGFDYLADASGEYRVVINYQNGCFSRFYFNIFKNPLNPQFVAEDIICASDGSITATNMPIDYEYSLLDAVSGNTLVGYQSSPIFPITSPGVYRVDMRQQGVGTGCVFTLDNIGILQRDMTLDVTVVDATCTGLGSIDVSALGVEPEYDFVLSQGGTPIDNSGITSDNRYIFPDLNPGTYDIEVTTTDGCVQGGTYTIQDLSNLSLSALTVKNVDCTDAEVSLTAAGGQPLPAYNYAIWSVDGVPLYPTLGDIPGAAYQQSTTFTFDASQLGDYVFVVVDGNNCHAYSNPVTVSELPEVTYTTTLTNETCYGYSDGSFELNILDNQGYALDFTLIYPDFSTQTNASGTFTGLPSGGYQLVVMKTMGGNTCDFIVPFSIGGPSAPLSAGISLVQGLSCTQDAAVQATNPMGGTPPYEYSLDGVNFVSGVGSDLFGGLGAGTYEITLRDANMCTFTSPSITIDPLSPPDDLSFSSTQMQCPGLTSHITATVANGEAPFVFEIVSPAPASPDSSAGDTATFDNLSAGTYRVRVTDALGCAYEEDYTLVPAPQIQASASVTSHVSCIGANDGEIRINVSDFQSTYSYTATGPSFNSSQTGQSAGVLVLFNLQPGSFQVALTDEDTQCTTTVNATVLGPPSPLDANISVTPPTCDTGARVEASAFGGWGFGYDYDIEYPSGTVINQPTGVFTGLNESGDHIVTISDANGCEITRTVTLSAPMAPVLSLVPSTACLSAGGSFDLTAQVTSGGLAPFEYRLNGGAYQSVDTFTGLSAGTYTVDVRDANNCLGTASLTVNDELALTVTHGNMDACGGDAGVTITANGGDGNYFYALLPQGTTPTPADFGGISSFTLGSAGNYTAWVRDQNGAPGYCEALDDFTIGVDDPLLLNLTAFDVNCNGADSGAITAGATGGQPPYQYRIGSGAFSSNPNFNGLTAGNYSVEVRDANGCTASDIATVQEMDELLASVAVTSLASCDSGDLSEVRVTNIIGGMEPVEYSFDGGANYGPDSSAMLPAGTYNIRVRDANLCEFSTVLTVDPPPANPVPNTSLSYECDGEGTVTIGNLDPGYDYTFALDGVPNTPADSPVFTDVATGSHTVDVDFIQNGPLPVSLLFTENFGPGPNTPINEIDPVYCYEPQDGSASLCGFGTDTHIQDGEYSVTNLIVNPYGAWLSPNDHSGLPGGRFLAINVGGVAGFNGIMYQRTDVEVIPNQDITISLWAFNLVRSTASNGDPSIVMELVDPSGTIIATTATGNVPKNTGPDDWHNYTVSLNPGANTTLDIVIRTTATFTSGNDIAIDDIQASQNPVLCSESLSLPFTVDPGNAIQGAITASSNVSCAGGSDGSISFEVQNFDPVDGFVYSVDGGPFSPVQTSSPITINGLSAGNHNIEVQDALDAGCTFNLSRSLSEPSALLAGASLTAVPTCINGGGTIEATATGGVAPFEYRLEDSLGAVLVPYQGTSTFNTLAPGDYFVRVRDGNGCDHATTVPVNVPAVTGVTFTAAPTTCYDGSNNGEIVLTVTSGNGSYLFQIDGGAWIAPTPSGSVTHTFGGLVAGTYQVNVRDAFGCVGVPANVTISQELSASITATDITACADGQIAATGSGGDGSYVFAFVPNGSSPAGLFGPSNTYAVSSGNEGDYDVYVRDQNGGPGYCEYMQTITVGPETPLSVSATPNDPTCYGETGSLFIQFSSGNAPFSIDLVDLDHGGAADLSLSNIFGNGTIYNLLSGNYELTITDADGCTRLLTPVITDPVELTADIVGFTPDCNPGTGEVQFTITSAPGGATIQYSTDGGGSWGNNNVIGGFNSGDVVDPSIRTIDAFGATICQTDYPPLTVPYPLDDLALDYATVDVVNCNELQVTVQGTNGTPDYQYTYSEDPANFDEVTPLNPWTPGTSGGYTFNLLIPGRSYTFYVRDASGCIRQNQVDVQTYYTSPLEVSSTSTPSCHGASTGSIDFSISTNTPPAVGDLNWTLYAIDGTSIDSGTIAGWSSPVGLAFPGLAPDTYYLEVEENDGVPLVCVSASANVWIGELDPLSATITALDPIRCNQPGRIRVENIDGGGGTYTFEVTDPLGGTFTTSDNPIEIAVGSDPGNYFVRMADQYGCFVDLGSVLIEQTPNPTIVSTDISQCTLPATLQINATSTIGAALQYSIDGGATYHSNGGLFTGLAPGLYTLTVMDENGCSDTGFAEIHPPLQLLVSLDKNLDCSPSPDALIGIDIQGGSSAFEYEVRDSGGVVVSRTTAPGTNFTYAAPTADTYTITVWDVGTDPNCSRSFDLDVPPAVQPDFTAQLVRPLCPGASDGRIELLASDNGILPLSYTISPAAGSFDPITQSFVGLPAGTYTVEATGSNDCVLTLPDLTLIDPAPISVAPPTVTPFSCGAGNTRGPALIEVNGPITGGSGSYVRYVFQDPSLAIVQDDTEDSFVVNDPAGGTYTISVYDSNGCVGTTTASVPPFDELISVSTVLSHPSCTPGGDGQIVVNTATTFSNPAVLQFSIDNGVSYQGSNIFFGLAEGNYNLMVRNTVTGCEMSTTATLDTPGPDGVDIVTTQPVICFGDTSAEITIELLDSNGYAGDVQYNIYNTQGTFSDLTDDSLEDSGVSPGLGPITVSGLGGGSYRVQMSQVSYPGCTLEEVVAIDAPTAPLASDFDLGPITCLGNDGTFSFYNTRGGWGNYEYYLGTAPPSGPGDYSPVVDYNGLVPGNYQGWVIDNLGCEAQVATFVLADPAPLSVTLSIDADVCGSNQGQLTASASGGEGDNYSYQLLRNGVAVGPVQSSPTFSGLGGGNYRVTVTDTWTCSATSPVETLYEPMSVVPAVIDPIDCILPYEGNADILVSGGSGTFEFELTYPDGITTQSNTTGAFNGLDQAGIYSVRVVDLLTLASNCEAFAGFELDAPVQPVLDAPILMEPSCAGGSDGLIQVVLQTLPPGESHDAPLEYRLYTSLGALLAGPQSDPVFGDLTAGDYEVTVTSARGCTQAVAITLSEPTPLMAGATSTDFSCSQPSSTVTVSASGGVPPYVYSLDDINYFTTPVFLLPDTGATQNLTLYVVDSSGCQTTTSITLEPRNQFTVGVTGLQPISCAQAERVEVRVTDDLNPANTYEFELLTPTGPLPPSVISSNITAEFELSAPGDYVFLVRDLTTGCEEVSAPYTVAPFDNMQLNLTQGQPVDCFGNSSGILELQVQNYGSTFDYELFLQDGTSTGISGSAGGTALSIPGLNGGSYYLMVNQTSAPFCSGTSNTVRIDSPDRPVSALISQVQGVGCTDDQGEILIEPDGGTPFYALSITGASTGYTDSVSNSMSHVFDGLSADVYTIVVTDAAGCSFVDTITLSVPPPISATLLPNDTTLDCYGDSTAVIEVDTVSGGQGSYQFQLLEYDPTGSTVNFQSGFQSGGRFANLGAGIYAIYIADGLGCEFTTPQVTITEPTEVTTLAIQSTAPTCAVQAEVTLTAQGGYGPYQYSLDGSTFQPMPVSGSATLTAPPGDYQFYVRDAFGCEANLSNLVRVEPVPSLELRVDDRAAVVNCSGEATASLRATASGGLGNYIYELYTDPGLSNRIDGPRTDGVFSGLPVGTYYIQVLSGDCTLTSEPYTVTDHPPLVADVARAFNISCTGMQDGRIEVEASGGYGQIYYAISPNLDRFDTENEFTELAAGTYQVVAQDELGCFVTFDFEIIEPSPIDLQVARITPETCVSAMDGTVELQISGGTPPYFTAVDSTDEADFVQDRLQLTGLSSGVHAFVVRDSQGCERTVAAEIEAGINLNATIAPLYSCPGTMLRNRLDVILEDPSVLPDVLFGIDTLDPARMSLDAEFGNLPAGEHYLTIAHVNGCVVQYPFQIRAYEELSVNMDLSRMNHFSATIEGGQGPYSVFLNDLPSSDYEDYEILESGQYTVRVVDDLGCEALATAYIEFYDLELADAFSPNGDLTDEVWAPGNREAYPNILITIYDRYGRELYKLFSDNEAWDGTYENLPLPSGDYWYTIQINGSRDQRKFVGHFTLYR